MPDSSPIIAALDTTELAQACSWARALAPQCGLLKFGLAFFLAHGGAGLREAAGGAPVFLDLKLHDIPNTVAGAVRAVAPVRPAMLTLHAAGGAAMIRAARQAADEAGGVRPRLLAVTVLTSLNAAALAETGVAGGPTQQALRLGRLAMEAGADGLVCSPQEIGALRDALGPEPLLVCPGIRPEGVPEHDQARTMTPSSALAAGADYLVIGRPITSAADPAAAAAAIRRKLP
jgi:orotidine-5'-phosphate decarboxylase